MLACGLCPAARAQIELSVSADSAYRYRGADLSDNRPDLRLNLDYDAEGGTYGGAALTQAQLYTGRLQAQTLAYLGVSRRTVFGLAWEIGATRALFAAEPRFDYGEFYAGLIGERWNLRTAFSPAYFGYRVRTSYIEWNGGLPLNAAWRVFGHLGALEVLSGQVPLGGRHSSLDARGGIGTALGDWDWQLARVQSVRGGLYPVIDSQGAGAWVLSVTRSF